MRIRDSASRRLIGKVNVMSNKLRSFLIVIMSIVVVMAALPMNALRVNADGDEETTQTVDYYLDGNSTSKIPVDYSGQATAEDPAGLGFLKNGYVFAGWTDDSNGTEKKYDIGDNLEPDVDKLFALWTFDSANFVKVTLIPNNDKVSSDAVTVPAPKTGTGIDIPDSWNVPDHYLFVKWTENSDGTGNDYGLYDPYTLTGDTDLYAQWEEIYIITYESNNGTDDKSLGKHDVNSTAPYQLDPLIGFTYEGYNFTGWFLGPESSAEPCQQSFTVDKDISIYAHWEFDTANYHKVIYYSDADQSSEYVQPVAKNSTEFSLINPVDSKKMTAPTGMRVASWNTQPDGNGTPYEKAQQIETQKLAADGDLILYAQWEKTPYSIEFLSEDGSTPIEALTCYYGDTPKFTQSNPSKEKTEDKVFVFDGWSTSKDSTGTVLTSLPEVTGDATYYAHFKSYPRYYLITANNPAEGGTVSSSGSCEWNESATVSVTLDTGYRVKNWIDNGSDVESTATTYTIDNVTEAHTVGVVLEKIPYTVSVSATEGGTAALENSNLVYGDTAKAVAAASTGYSFVYWTEGANVVSSDPTYSFTVTADCTLTAVFQLNSYDINLTSDGYGTVDGGGAHNHFSTANITAAPNTGYHFVNWTDENGDEVSKSAAYSFEVDGARSLKANFAVNSYNIDVTAGDHGSVTGTGIYNHFESITVKAKPETGYHFVNWTIDGNVVSTNANYTFTVSGPADLTANFAINTYTVKFVNDDGTLLREGQFVYGSTAFYQVNVTPTKKPTAQYTYTFAGWDKKLGTVTEDITYTATYEATVNKYKITFQNEDGSVLQTGEVEYGKLPVFEKGTPTKASTVQESFTFAGWDKEISKVTGEAVYTATYTSKKITRDDINYLHFTVTFESNGGSEVVSQLVADGGVAFKPEEPMRERYTFGGWYIDAALTKPFSFATPITSDITLYAKWIKGSPEVEATYAVVGLGSMSWTQGSDEDFTVAVERSKDNDTIASHFKGVQIDGVDLDYYLYSLSEDNSAVIIRSDAFDDLDAGSHTVTIVYDDGKAEAELIITKADKPAETEEKVTPTEAGGGEPEVITPEKPSLLGLWIALAIVGGVVVCALPIIIIKRRGVK